MKPIHIFLIHLFLYSGIVTLKAQNISFPDENFKAALIDQGVDTNGDGNIQKSEAAPIKKLHVNNANISSLVGIKNFTGLEELAFLDNRLTSADFEGMKNLKYLYGNNNKLTQLKLKGCTNLEVIFMDQNELSALDLSGMVQLRDIRINVNKLRSIDLSRKPKLEKVMLFRNELTQFKADESPELKELDLSRNQITEMDLRRFSRLKEADLNGNPLRKINVTGLGALEKLYCEPAPFAPALIKQMNTSGLVSLKEYKW
ncbi:hypothetical protein ACM46_15160 [Chryseobacterium angstadtii]|uniref:Internalin n=1 Tax=Chryseobacterium angstadtii TaxID=558151 RepID=A0A0J7I6D0_9FLAO|nr:leucine-rich repeat domain-containing protein [Chryseobacterium angstadtii]KMQ61366.1 hypothetical protein ACM46_15160 [Chryseobacterium angstadtii]